MSLSDERIAGIVKAARERAGLAASAAAAPPREGPAGGPAAAPGQAAAGPTPWEGAGRSLPGGSATADSALHGIFPTLEQAVSAASGAFQEFSTLPLTARKAMLANVRRRLRERVELLSRMAVGETGLGRIEDKRIKNLLVIDKTPGPEILVPECQTGDDGLVLTEWAPYGVIGSITPVTNPSETVINNGIGMLAAGNAVVFNGHPSAKDVTRTTISIMNEAVVEAGGPRNLLTSVRQPTIETAQALMQHRAIRLLVVTGGAAVVKAALQSGKRCITAGPGNPPAVVDETADLPKAARDITLGASLDNNIICTAEKLVIVVEAVRERFLAELQRLGNVVLRPDQLPLLERVIFEQMRGPRQRAVIQRAWVGKNARHVLAKIGVQADDACRLAIVPCDNDHPLLWTEQMMPVLPVTSAPDAETAMELAIQMEGHNRHTFTMHSKRVDRLSAMARKCDASIFVKNGPNFAGLGQGGEGPTSFTIATPTGEGLTDARSFSRRRRCTLVGEFRIV